MRIPHGVNASNLHVPRMLAAGIGALVQAAEVASELGAESARAVLDRRRSMVRRAERGYREAATKGDQAIGQAAAEASRRMSQAADGAAAWAERTIVRRVARSMTPYLIDELVPEVIDGVLPVVRTDVIPVVIADLTNDEQVRAMVAQQSQDMLTWSVTEVRRAAADGDNRVESALHRALGRRDKRT